MVKESEDEVIVNLNFKKYNNTDKEQPEINESKLEELMEKFIEDAMSKIYIFTTEGKTT